MGEPRFQDHPDELARAAAMREPRVAPLVTDSGQPRDGEPPSATRWWWLGRWVFLSLFFVQGVATLILFVLGGSEDKVGVSLMWTGVWLFSALVPLMRFG